MFQRLIRHRTVAFQCIDHCARQLLLISPVTEGFRCVVAGTYEIRVHVLGEWRVIYVAKFADAVYVLHAFQKRTQQTRKEDIELASARYKQLKESAK